jgi:protease I
MSASRILIFVGDDYEDLELWYPKLRLEEAGLACVVAGLEAAGTKYSGKHGYPCVSDAQVRAVRSEDYAAVVIPGGWMPDKLRRYPEVTALVRAVHDAGKPVGIICHGGLIAISAGIIGRDHPVTGSLGIRDDLVNAGGRWVDEPAFRDGNLVWGRVVEDIPAFERELVALLAEHNR